MKISTMLAGAALLPIPAVAGAADGGGAGFAGSLAQMVCSLLLVIGIILILYHLAGRFLKLPKGGTPFRYIRVVETRHLAPKKSLMLVEVGGEYLLLSDSGDGVNFIKQVQMLEEIEILDEQGYATLIPVQFRNRLKEMASEFPAGVTRLRAPKKNGGFA